jgi:hypothetical protein
MTCDDLDSKGLDFVEGAYDDFFGQPGTIEGKAELDSAVCK